MPLITDGQGIADDIKACLLQDPCWTMLCECCDCGELLINGGFEQGSITGNFEWVDQGSVDGWDCAIESTTPTGNWNIEFWNGAGMSTPAYEGTYFVELQAQASEGWGVTQTVTISDGGTQHTLSFAYQARNEHQSPTDYEDFEVEITNTTTGTLTTYITDSITGSWKTKEIVFTPNASTVMVTIKPTNPSDQGCFLDAVSLTGQCCENGPPPEPEEHMLALSLPIENHYIPIKIGNDVFKAKADVSVIDPKDTIQRNENLINWESNDIDHFIFTSTKNPIVFKKDKHIFQYKDKWIALLLINLEPIPCPVLTYEYVLNTRKTNESKPSGFALVVKDGIYKASDFTLENLANEEKLEDVNLISSPNNIFV